VGREGRRQLRVGQRDRRAKICVAGAWIVKRSAPATAMFALSGFCRMCSSAPMSVID